MPVRQSELAGKIQSLFSGTLVTDEQQDLNDAMSKLRLVIGQERVDEADMNEEQVIEEEEAPAEANDLNGKSMKMTENSKTDISIPMQKNGLKERGEVTVSLSSRNSLNIFFFERIIVKNFSFPCKGQIH